MEKHGMGTQPAKHLTCETYKATPNELDGNSCSSGHNKLNELSWAPNTSGIVALEQSQASSSLNRTGTHVTITTLNDGLQPIGKLLASNKVHNFSLGHTSERNNTQNEAMNAPIEQLDVHQAIKHQPIVGATKPCDTNNESSNALPSEHNGNRSSPGNDNPNAVSYANYEHSVVTQQPSQAASSSNTNIAYGHTNTQSHAAMYQNELIPSNKLAQKFEAHPYEVASINTAPHSTSRVVVEANKDQERKYHINMHKASYDQITGFPDQPEQSQANKLYVDLRHDQQSTANTVGLNDNAYIDQERQHQLQNNQQHKTAYSSQSTGNSSSSMSNHPLSQHVSLLDRSAQTLLDSPLRGQQNNYKPENYLELKIGFYAPPRNINLLASPLHHAVSKMYSTTKHLDQDYDQANAKRSQAIKNNK